MSEPNAKSSGGRGGDRGRRRELPRSRPAVPRTHLPVAACDAWLQVKAHDLDPELVTRLLGCEPTERCRRGDRSGFRGRPELQFEATVGLWTLHPKMDYEVSAEGKIRTILESATSDLDAWEALSEIAAVELYCTVMVDDDIRCWTLSPDVLRAVAERRISLELSANPW